MMMLKTLAIVLLPMLAFAQENNQITVTGTALKSVAPNELHITAGVSKDGPMAEKTYKEVTEIMAKTIASLKNKNGVKSFETQLIQMSTPYGMTNPNFYNCTQTITIILTDFDLYDKLMLELFAMGFNNISNVQFNVSNLPELKRTVELEAIAAAQEKAEAVAGALGVQLGPVVSFSEENTFSGAARLANYAQADQASAGGTSIAPNQVEVLVSVIVSFAINSKK